MGITHKVFQEMSDENGVGVKIVWRINGVDYGFACFQDKTNIGKALRQCAKAMCMTLLAQDVTNKEECREIVEEITTATEELEHE